MTERLPTNHGDCRLTFHNGQYHLVVTMPAQSQWRVRETQARAVALDPGIRSFLTWFSETDAGHIAPGAFGKIQRLCAHLDNLLSRAKLEKRRFAKRNKYRAADRMRVRIRNLIDELHHQVGPLAGGPLRRHPAAHFRDFPEMALRGARKLRAKSVRSMLTYAHYPVPAVSQVEVLADGQSLAVGERGVHQQDLLLVWRGHPESGRGESGAGERRGGARQGQSMAPAGYSCGLWEIHLLCAKPRRDTSATALTALLALVSEKVSA